MLYLTDFSTASNRQALSRGSISPASRNREILEKSIFSKISGFPPQAGRLFSALPYQANVSVASNDEEEPVALR